MQRGMVNLMILDLEGTAAANFAIRPPLIR